MSVCGRIARPCEEMCWEKSVREVFGVVSGFGIASVFDEWFNCLVAVLLVCAAFFLGESVGKALQTLRNFRV